MCFCLILHMCCIIVSTGVRGAGADGIEPLSLGPIFLRYFDSVGWVIWPAKTCPRYDLCVWWDVKLYSTVSILCGQANKLIHSFNILFVITMYRRCILCMCICVVIIQLFRLPHVNQHIVSCRNLLNFRHPSTSWFEMPVCVLMFVCQWSASKSGRSLHWLRQHSWASEQRQRLLVKLVIGQSLTTVTWV